MARLVLPDLCEDLAEDRMRRLLRHAEEQRRTRDFAHHERCEENRERVLAERLAVAFPIAPAVVVEPLNVIDRRALEVGRRLEIERATRNEFLNDALTALLMIHLVARDRKEAFANWVFGM